MEIISFFISSILTMISIYILGIVTVNKDNNKNINKIKFYICLIISAMLYTFVFVKLEGIIKTLSMCLIFTLFLYQTVYREIGKSFLAAMLYAILGIIPDLIIIGMITKIFSVTKEYMYTHLAGNAIGNMSTSFLMIILILPLKNVLKRIMNYNLSTNKKIIIVSLLTLISLTIFFYNFISTFRLNNGIIGYIVIIITLIVILFYLFKQKMDNDIILKKYDDLLNIMKNYENDIEEQRIMVHETRNELMTIKSKISDKEKEASIIKYIDSILGDKVSSKMSNYSKFKYLPSNGIKGFFYYKFTEAEKRNIKVSVNISKKIEKSFLGNLDTKNFKDLVRIIGVYLDNAIEASAESHDKKLGIEIYLTKNDIEIIISNTFENKVNIDKLGKEKFTTKGKHHGHGLLLVKHILRNNSIFESYNEITNGLYIQKLKIKDTKEKTQ